MLLKRHAIRDLDDGDMRENLCFFSGASLNVCLLTRPHYVFSKETILVLV